MAVIIPKACHTFFRKCSGLLAGLFCVVSLSLVTGPSVAVVPVALPPSSISSLPVLSVAPLFQNILKQSAWKISDSEAARYQFIFALQDAGLWAMANQEIEKLEDKRLLGHVLFQRYMHLTAYRSKFSELSDWLKHYADHPGAKRIYRLALRRMPQGARHPFKPKSRRNVTGAMEDYGRVETAFVYQNRSLFRKIRRQLQKKQFSVALGTLKANQETLNFSEVDALQTNIATRLFFNGRDKKALDLAASSAERSRKKVPSADWVAGLSAWRLKDYSVALRHFSYFTRADNILPSKSTAGAYWAARAALKLGDNEQAVRFLKYAAYYPGTFYGLLASDVLGVTPAFQWGLPEFTGHYLDVLAGQEAGIRALLLLQAGQRGRAEQELQHIRPRGDKDLERALLAVAHAAGLPSLSLRIASLAKTPNSGRYDAALYPIPPWTLAEGFSVDRALIYAFMRQESRFDPEARSSVGAFGLMQLMPRTASYIYNGTSKSFRGITRYELMDPALNLELAQRYLGELLNNRRVKKNLFKLAVAYNGGLGNLRKWQEGMNYQNDPLLFIETIPVTQTHHFVEHVLTNYWIYRLRLGQDTPSLRALTEGEWPVYEAVEGGTI